MHIPFSSSLHFPNPLLYSHGPFAVVQNIRNISLLITAVLLTMISSIVGHSLVLLADLVNPFYVPDTLLALCVSSRSIRV